LQAECEGSEDEPYLVQATLGGKMGVLRASCNCQYDYSGYCKHIVALLLTYARDADSFEIRDATPAPLQLAKRSKDDLIALIKIMLLRHPDLHDLLDQPLPAKGQITSAKVDTASYGKQLRSALREYDEHSFSRTIKSILHAVEGYIYQGDDINASLLCRMVLDATFDDDNTYLNLDEDGWLSDQIEEVLQLLYGCLERLQDNEIERRHILIAILQTRLWDIQIGGHDIGFEGWDYLLRFVKPADVAELQTQIEAAKAKHAARTYSDWSVSQCESLLIDLDSVRGVDPEVILHRLRANGEWEFLFSRLLEMKRVDEAVSVVETQLTNPYVQHRYLRELIAAGEVEAAIRLAEKTLNQSYQRTLLEWLLDQLEGMGDKDRKLHWQTVQLKEEPSIDNYNKLERAATALGKWDALRPQIIHWLEQHRQYMTIARIRLQDGDFDLAWTALEMAKPGKEAYNQHSWQQLELDVADKTRDVMPEKSLPVYVRHVRRLIEERNRASYESAARLLLTVRDLYDRIDEFEKWEALITDIRKQFPKLRALHEEIKKQRL
jgi:hypothetical protein